MSGIIVTWRRAKTVVGEMAIIRVGRRHIDIRIARRVPWVKHTWRRMRSARTKDGWLTYIDCPPLFHLRIQYHTGSPVKHPWGKWLEDS